MHVYAVPNVPLKQVTQAGENWVLSASAVRTWLRACNRMFAVKELFM